ncbi:DNA-directed RNA polymerase subunit beta' [Candidatus Peregrinibacteria bacterium]|nr:DNA-directed RNA polymerase subunit beta' [Candidatus Peregrinibacteria bacterium]
MTVNQTAHQTNKKNNEQFDRISVSVASPDEILDWSTGEVKKPETINYRTQKPERDGLFCEKIFGPTKNYECYCGKYKRIRYKGVICEKCGVEVTHSSVRRNRMGHIKLAVPVTHIWFLRSTPSRIGLLLDLPIKAIEQVVYFAAYIITDVDYDSKKEALETLQSEYKSTRKKYQEESQKMVSDAANKKDKSMIDKIEKEYANKIEDIDKQYKNNLEQLNGIDIGKIYSELEYRELSTKFGQVFRAGIGAEAIRRIIENLDLQKLINELKEEQQKTSGQKQKKVIKRLKLAGSLLKAGIKPEWMVMTVLPVIPPDLRPMVQLDGGRYAASDLNDLYRRVINRNNRLKRLMSIGAPEVISRNEKRMLQEAVDTLLNNSARQGKTVFNSGDKRKLRSLSDMLKGKQGRFRQNLLGKRVDYSGRSVIVVGPQLKLNQCGLPKAMALELFKPFVIGRLIADGHAHNIKSSEKLIQAGNKEVWDILEEVTRNRYVLLNRAPTLHRLGIQAFKPVLVEGKAIQIHPLVCTAFNADFDGDQMAVHVPLSKQAQEEAKILIASYRNLLKPSAGEPIVAPTQDMVLGCYYLTKETPGKKGEGMVFTDINEAMLAWREEHLHLQTKIKARVEGDIKETTLGRMIFNSFRPIELPYCNETVGKKQLSTLLNDSFLHAGSLKTAKFADALKRIGFQFATYSGLSIAAADMIIPENKESIIEEAEKIIKRINNIYQNGLITDDERYVQTIKIWNQAKADITKSMISSIDPENDLHYMINSGARGNWGQITQLCGMKGNVANPAGKTIELPITSNLKEGFSILEYFIATHGGRKGKSDTALKTAEAGHLTRRLVDSVQDIIIKEFDCGSDHVHHITVQESDKIGVKLENRIFGRTLAEDIIDAKTGEVLVEKGAEIDRGIIKIINDNNIQQIGARSVLTCQTKGGVCSKCYGRDLGTNETVEIGTAVGIIAAQSIGEPGTQLTMRTFHMGGVASAEGDITQGLTRVEELFEARNPKSPAVMSELDGIAKIHHKGQTSEITIKTEEPLQVTYQLTGKIEPIVQKGDIVKEKEIIAKDKNKNNIRAEYNGKIIDITADHIVLRSNDCIEVTYKIPFGKIIKISNGEKVRKGQALCSGHLNLKQLMELTNVYSVLKYIVSEVQTIYASQGQTINDKHIEIIARQMLSKIRISDPGDSDLIAGEINDILTVEKINRELEVEGKKLVTFERLLLGLTRISLHTDSWLSAASFQETIRVLVEASTTNKMDYLEGLKENVIIGKLIPAGATYRKKHPDLIPEFQTNIEIQPEYDAETPDEEKTYPIL